jgi:RNase H-fold protein (predicted Holliday junction resolvase)
MDYSMAVARMRRHIVVGKPKHEAGPDHPAVALGQLLEGVKRSLVKVQTVDPSNASPLSRRTISCAALSLSNSISGSVLDDVVACAILARF